MRPNGTVLGRWGFTPAALPALIYLWLSAAYLLILGLGSLIVNPDFAVGDDASGDQLFGTLETNGWHGAAGVLLGLAAFAFALSGRQAWLGAVFIGASSLASGVVFLLYGDGAVAIGLIRVDATDAVLLHILPGVVGLLCAAVPLTDRLPIADADA